MKKHEFFMERCLELAAKGIGAVSPNPLVGSVVVHNDQIIGEGYHQKFGSHHAEVEAILSITDCELLPSSTLYVNLEPCSHHGKTPPCAQKILDCKIPKVVLACLDPNPKVSGKGVEMLKSNGVEVIQGILEDRSRWLNRAFMTYHERLRPYVILKWAQSRDGFMDMDRKDEKGIFWISSEVTKSLVHQWRAECDAILVGSKTVINDDPELTVREVEGENPLRVIFDPESEVQGNLKVLMDGNATIIFGKSADSVSQVRRIVVDEKQVIKNSLEYLWDEGIQSILVEGGKQTLESFIESGIWDEFRVIVGNTKIEKGLAAPPFPIEPSHSEKSGPDMIYTGYRL